MTTNKPEVVKYIVPKHEAWDVRTLVSPRFPSEQLMVLASDYDALQAECEKLRNLLRHAQPIMRAHAGASHMLDGFRPRRNQWDELVEAIDAAMQEPSHDNQ